MPCSRRRCIQIRITIFIWNNCIIHLVNTWIFCIGICHWHIYSLIINLYIISTRTNNVSYFFRLIRKICNMVAICNIFNACNHFTVKRHIKPCHLSYMICCYIWGIDFYYWIIRLCYKNIIFVIWNIYTSVFSISNFFQSYWRNATTIISCFICITYSITVLIFCIS